jgi:hypothetical protein
MYPWDGLQHGGKNDQYEGEPTGDGVVGFGCNVVFYLVMLCLFLSLFAPDRIRAILESLFHLR